MPMYLTLTSRPDLNECVNCLIRFQNSATDFGQNHLKRVLRYLKKTSDMELTYDAKSSKTLLGYSESDCGNDVDDRKSKSGYLIKVFVCSTPWLTRKQPTVQLSSFGAEFIALCVTVCEIVSNKKLLKDLDAVMDYPVCRNTVYYMFQD